jgi:hypothetical protein
MTVDLQPNGYDETRGRRFYQQLLDNMRRSEGIDSASLAAVFPMTMVDSASQKVLVEGYHPQRDEDLMFLYNVVTDDYFRTLGIGIEAGREFARHDDGSAQQVAIINDTLARRFWGNPQNAIGKRLRAGSDEWRTIVGVARDIKYARINENPRPYVYLPFLQAARSSMILHARNSTGTRTLLDQARREVHKLDPDLPVLDAKTLSDQTSAALGVFEITARILLALGLAAMGLSAMGLCGLVSYAAKQSTHEIGIRLTLGATRRPPFPGTGLVAGGDRGHSRNWRVLCGYTPIRESALRRQRDRRRFLRGGLGAGAGLGAARRGCAGMESRANRPDGRSSSSIV